MITKGILLDEATGDLDLSKGRMSLGDCRSQTAEILLLAEQGEIKEYPNLGLGIQHLLGGNFEEQFSQVSLESILFYTFATAIWLLEKLFYEHRAEIEERLADLRPHTLRWYELKAKAFRLGQKLLHNSDKYSDKNLTPQDIKKLQVVKYAVASESKNVVYLKVAGQNDKGKPRLLTADEYADFVHYISEIKDAGVLFDIINKPADKIKLEIDVYVPASLIGATTELEQELKKEVERVLYELPFDGRYRSSDLLTAIEKVDKVEVAYIRSSLTQGREARQPFCPWRLATPQLGITPLKN